MTDQEDIGAGEIGRSIRVDDARATRSARVMRLLFVAMVALSVARVVAALTH